jgi:hypothetical protein
MAFTSREDLERAVADLRADMIRHIGLDLGRRVKSSTVQRKLRSGSRQVEIVRLEVMDRIYLPLNVHLPPPGRRQGAPIVMLSLGCGSSPWDAGPQALAANLADMGMLAVVSEGFCNNGSRDTVQDGDLLVGYARELMGLPSTTAVHLQELVSELTWLIDRYPFANAERVGVAGYSYGGGMSQLLAEVDRRVRSLSVPATSVGLSCDARVLPVSDLYLLDGGGDEPLWGAPLEVPMYPRNVGILLLYPRYLHTTAGARDISATPQVIGAAMGYARKTWALAGLSDRVLFRADDGGHNYDRERREHTYEWFARTLLEGRVAPRPEREFPPWPADELAVDLSGTGTLRGEMESVVESERARRAPGGAPTEEAGAAARLAAREIFGARTTAFSRVVSWEGSALGYPARTIRYRGEVFDVPALELAGRGSRGSGKLLVLPEHSVAEELELLRQRAARFERVVAVDYLGIGELASTRVTQHTFAWYLMHSEESLPRLNVALLRGVLQHLGADRVDIEGVGWAASTYAGILAALEPTRVRRLHLSGVPDDELGWIRKRGNRVPDLLLHPALFLRLTARELAIAQLPNAR